MTNAMSIRVDGGIVISGNRNVKLDGLVMTIVSCYFSQLLL